MTLPDLAEKDPMKFIETMKEYIFSRSTSREEQNQEFAGLIGFIAGKYKLSEDFWINNVPEECRDTYRVGYISGKAKAKN